VTPRLGASSLGGDRVEGRRAVAELLTAGRRRVRTVWVASERSDDLAEIADIATRRGIQVRELTREELDDLSATEVPQGVVADADPLEPTAVDDLLTAPSAFLVALDGVTDPQNLGAVLRAAETAGVTGIVLPRHRSAHITPAAAKAAAGAIEYLPIATVAGIPAVIIQAARADVWTIGLDAGGDVAIDDLTVADRPLMLVLGAEGRGLSRLARERCDVVASIPMHGHVASLNVGAAAAIACATVARLRTATL
jgi:23S rRNA (guanosine2251-2'-O)-methyltransferase